MRADICEEKRASRAQQEKLAYKKRTFAKCAEEEVIKIKTKELKNQKHIAQWRSTLETYSYPFIGQKVVSKITKAHVLTILEPI